MPISKVWSTIRRSDGGRRPTIENTPDIDEIFLEILREHTAGNLMDEKVKWTNLKRGEIRESLRSIKVSINIVKKILKKHDFVKRKALKKTSTGQHKRLSVQEANGEQNMTIVITRLSVLILKESIGNLYRDGHLETIEVFDHDFPNLADEKVNLYSVYDFKNNESFVNI